MAKFQKGNRLGGRKKGSVNRVTQPIREKYLQLLNDNLEQMQKDLDGLEPKDRIQLLLQMTKYVIPQLKSVELVDEQDPTPRMEFIFKTSDKDGKALIEFE